MIDEKAARKRIKVARHIVNTYDGEGPLDDYRVPTWVPILRGLSDDCEFLLMRNKDLLPCPMCGGEALMDTSDGVTRVYCDKCGVSTKTYTLKDEAIDAWNRRP